MTGRSVRWVVVAAAAGALSLACGSTVVPSASTDGAGLAGELADGGRATSGTSIPRVPATDQRGPGGGASGAGPTADVVQPGGTMPSPTAAGTGNLRVSVPGMTSSTISIGVYTALGFNSAAAAAGAEGANTGDHRAQAQAIAEYLNDHGGMAGRRVRLVFHDQDLSKSAPAEAQTACSVWTEDDRVFAMVSPTAIAEESLYACLGKKGVISSQAGEVFDRPFFEKYADTYYQPSDINQTRTFRTVVDALAPTTFFGRTPKIAVIARDIGADRRAVREGLVPALTSHGIRLADEFYVPIDFSQQSSAYSSAVLRFKTNGVTHVVFASLASPVMFGVAAESQAFRPRYALNSRNAPAALLQGNVPDAQLRGAMGAGWMPYEDVDNARDPGPVTPRAKLCKELMEDAGQDTSVRATALIGAWYCDTLFFLHDVLARATSFDPSGMRRAAESLGTGYLPASSFQARFGPGRTHDGASAYRLFEFADGCRCFQYVGPLRAAP